MTVINSVLGPLDTRNLGLTLMHEHIVACGTGISQNYPELLGPDFMDRLIEDGYQSPDQYLESPD